MNILAIDTSTVAASAAVVNEDKLCAEFYTDIKLKHSEKLMFLIDGVLTNLRMSLDDIDLIACGKGPGSFTGLRIGAATAKAIAHAKEIKVAGISSLKACAYQNMFYSQEICAIFDAQQESLYCGIYKNTKGMLETVLSDRVIKLKDLTELLNARNNDILFCGDAVKKYRQQLAEELQDKASFAPDVSLMPHASSVGKLALCASADEIADYNTFLPEYIRKSQAEVNYSIKL